MVLVEVFPSTTNTSSFSTLTNFSMNAWNSISLGEMEPSARTKYRFATWMFARHVLGSFLCLILVPSHSHALVEQSVAMPVFDISICNIAVVPTHSMHGVTTSTNVRTLAQHEDSWSEVSTGRRTNSRTIVGFQKVCTHRGMQVP